MIIDLNKKEHIFHRLNMLKEIYLLKSATKEEKIHWFKLLTKECVELLEDEVEPFEIEEK